MDACRDPLPRQVVNPTCRSYGCIFQIHQPKNSYAYCSIASVDGFALKQDEVVTEELNGWPRRLRKGSDHQGA